MIPEPGLSLFFDPIFALQVGKSEKPFSCLELTSGPCRP